MVKESTLTLLREFINNLIKTQGMVDFAVAIPDSLDDENSSVTLFLSAPWIDSTGYLASMSLVINELRNTITTDSSAYISRISLVNINDPMLRTFFPVHVENSNIVVLSQCNLAGVPIDEAYVYVNHQN